jgi:hypothetical protein
MCCFWNSPNQKLIFTSHTKRNLHLMMKLINHFCGCENCVLNLYNFKYHLELDPFINLYFNIPFQIYFLFLSKIERKEI